MGEWIAQPAEARAVFEENLTACYKARKEDLESSKASVSSFPRSPSAAARASSRGSSRKGAGLLTRCRELMAKSRSPPSSVGRRGKFDKSKRPRSRSGEDMLGANNSLLANSSLGETIPARGTNNIDSPPQQGAPQAYDDG